jgi:hypothetical protein
MGRIYLIYLLLFLVYVRPVFADTVTRQINITAGVLPSPEWITLVQTHSAIYRINLPLINFVFYQLHLTDGHILLKNQPVDMTVSAPGQIFFQTQFTDPKGVVKFFLPDSYASAAAPVFTFTIMNREISLKYL